MRLLLLILLCVTANLYGKENHQKNHPSKDEIMAQRVAFITQELDLTPAEAEKFWPLYNENNTILKGARRATMHSLVALNKALEVEPPVADTEIQRLTEEYLSNYKREGTIYVENFNKYQKILPLRKAVKLFNAEEKFRVYLIKNLRGDNPPPPKI